ncbi:MAG: right-handed parallel beta-helix repeat-containing protein [Pirellulaceae bacterium]|nr:right-handed parallel beta-helix repeat-containing protein [Pirellulaceae bacterium]
MPKPTICLTLLLIHTAQALATDYWVATDGSDTDPGSREKPVRTLQRAADAIRPGDTCTVRGGTYREAVTIRHSGTAGKPIRFVAAEGESVILDGTDLVTGKWTRYKDAIYCATVDGPVEQVFVDGVMQIEARWPNMRFEEIWDRTKWARSDHGSRKDLMICDAIAETGIDWTGALATLNVGHQYKTWTRDVTEHSKGSSEFTYELNERLGDGRDDGPSWADDCFYLSGKLEALDAPTEWHHDARTGTLYLWCDDGRSPAAHQVAVKRRTYAIDAFRRDCIQIIGFHFFAATLRLNQCNHCLVDRCRLRFPVYSRRFDERTPEGKREPEPSTLVAGDHNTIRDTSIGFSNLGGLLVRGSHCRIENCIVHDVNWGGNISHPGLSLQGRTDEDNHNVVSRSTVYGVGNIGILYGGRANTIEYNNVFDTGRACRDIAAVHTGGVRAMGSVAHHNWVHDSTELGLRGDDQTRGLTFHHNVVWNCRRGMIMKGNLNKVYHNTVLVDPRDAHATASIVIPKRAEPKKWWTRQPTLPVQNEDTLVFNNAAYLIADRGGTPTPASDRVSHNVILPRDLLGVFAGASDEALASGTFDLRPAPGSPLIDAGRLAPSVGREPDSRSAVGQASSLPSAVNSQAGSLRHGAGYHGKAPDVGAYEAGGERWVAGADWQDEPIGVQMVVRLEPPRTHHSIPLPTPLYKSGISAKGLRKLQKLYDELWTEDDRVSARQKAIALRERYPENSPERNKHHAIVAKLHREVWLLLRDRGSEVLTDEDRAAFEKTMGVK